MKLFSFLLVLFSCLGMTAERVNDELPIIKDTIRELRSAEGWIKNPEGQWISRKSRIASYIPKSLAGAIDSEKHYYGLGIDNFRKITVYDFYYKKKRYDLVIKEYSSGQFRYRSLEEGWFSYNKYAYFVIEKGGFDNISVHKDKATLIKVPAVYSGSIDSPKSREDFASLIKTDLNLKESNSTLNIDKNKYKHLIINAYFYEKSNAMRFILFGASSLTESGNGSVSEGIVGYFNHKQIPVDDRNIYFKPEFFDYMYYEVSLKEFKELINVTIGN